MRLLSIRIAFVSLAFLALAPTVATAITRAERKAVDIEKVSGASTADAVFLKIAFRGNITERLGRRRLKETTVRIELRSESGPATVITDRRASRRPRERRRGTEGWFDVVRTGSRIVVLVEDLPAPVTEVEVTTVKAAAGASQELTDEQWDELLKDLPQVTDPEDAENRIENAEQEIQSLEALLEHWDREADRTIDRIHRAQSEFNNAKSGAKAREAREELENQKKRLEELTERRRTYRRLVRILRRWINHLRAIAEGDVSQCSDGKDNGDPEDEIADHATDPGCVSPDDNDEKDTELPVSCPAPGGMTRSFGIINTPQSNTFNRIVLRMDSGGEIVVDAPVDAASGGPFALPGDICGPGMNVTYRYTVYTDGDPFGLPDPPPGKHALCTTVDVHNPEANGNPGGQTVALRLGVGTAAAEQ